MKQTFDMIDEQTPSPYEQVMQQDLQRHLLTALTSCLLPKEATILQMRFGINCKAMSLRAVGKVFSVGPERIRQLEAKALRKLRHPLTSNKLVELLT